MFQSRNLEVPLITTTFVSPTDPWARNILYITGGTDVPFFQAGFWRFPGARLAQMKIQIAGLAAIGRAYKMGMGVPNTAAEAVIADLDPNWVGWDFDPSQATPDLPLEKASPRVKMFILRDAKRENGQLTPCPLGEGIVRLGEVLRHHRPGEILRPSDLTIRLSGARPPASYQEGPGFRTPTPERGV